MSKRKKKSQMLNLRIELAHGTLKLFALITGCYHLLITRFVARSPSFSIMDKEIQSKKNTKKKKR
jgi:hypothetical protein